MFDEYYKKIEKLTNFDKEDILNKDFELYHEKNMAIYYAPHNEIINEKAKIFIVGITPGWTQTSIAYQTANLGIKENLSKEEIKRTCKKNSRFAGSMRKNIIEMLDELGINRYLKINSCASLFDADDYLLHTTSVIPYPVFVNHKNYTGSNPKILENDILKNYVQKYFYKEVSILSDAFYIPLGKSVEEVLKRLIQEGILKKEQCLLGFPHPSGANGHRKKQFETNKKDFQKIVQKYFREIDKR